MYCKKYQGNENFKSKAEYQDNSIPVKFGFALQQLWILTILSLSLAKWKFRVNNHFHCLCYSSIIVKLDLMKIEQLYFTEKYTFS